MEKVKVGIVGAAGYSGIELCKLLLRHPAVEISVVTSGSNKGKLIQEVYPYFLGKLDLVFIEFDAKLLKEKCDLVFFATPSGACMKQAKEFYDSDVKIIDLSGDHRLISKEMYKEWYKYDHDDIGNINKWVYGLPEIFSENIKTARYIANPGCYPTSVLLGLLPFFKYNSNIVINHILIDSKSGISGKGKKLIEDNLFLECNENTVAYKISGKHQHIPEIELGIKRFCNLEKVISFNPSVVPMDRGILSNINLLLEYDVNPEDIIKYYREFYLNKSFVKVLNYKQLPSTKSVIHTNDCNIGIDYDKRTKILTIVSVIDNLLKGASGEAIQNMNLMYGFNENLGLL